MINAQLNSGVLMPKITNVKLTPMLPVKKFAKGQYTLVDYEMDMQMNMAQPGKEKEMEGMLKNPEELASFQNMMKSMLSASLGEGSSLEFEKNSFLVNVHQKNQFIAINENDSGWKVAELSVATATMLENVLPKEIAATYQAQIDDLKAKAKGQMEAMMKAMGAK